MIDARDAVDELLAAHCPASAREVRSVRRARAYLRWLASPLDRDADPVHVTASAIVVDGAGRTVLHLHRRLGRWLQPGGHLDPGELPADAALREALEETGLPLRHPEAGPRLLHVDVHDGPRGHLHLDLRYLLLAPAHAPFAPAPGESAQVAWFALPEAERRADPGLAEALRIVADCRGV